MKTVRGVKVIIHQIEKDQHHERDIVHIIAVEAVGEKDEGIEVERSLTEIEVMIGEIRVGAEKDADIEVAVTIEARIKDEEEVEAERES